MSRVLLVLFLLLTCVVSSACADQGETATSVDVSVEELNMQLGNKTILFGHQSVGANILDGVEELRVSNPDLQLTVAEVGNAADATAPLLLHTLIGENYDPMSKLQGFDELIRSPLGEQVDVAFFKLCYVDFDNATDADVDTLFENYKQTMDALVRDYPQITFVYVTVPLMAKGQGLKAFVKNVIGRTDPAVANLQRHRFNELLRAEYGTQGRVFDLAAFEASYGNDQTCTMKVNNQTVPCLYAQYTDDGGHLNELGRRVLSTQLLTFLSGL